MTNDQLIVTRFVAGLVESGVVVLADDLRAALATECDGRSGAACCGDTIRDAVRALLKDSR